MKSKMDKVTAYITRQKATGADELLVFQPANVGVQVPAGTVEPGESFDDAVVRETHEETGLADLPPARLLGSVLEPLTDQRALLEDVTLLRGPGVEADPGFRLPRAYWLRVSDRVDGYAEVVVESYNHHVKPPVLLQRFSGWVPVDLLATHMERHFYHFALTGPTPDRWEVEDNGERYECYWVSLMPMPVIEHYFGLWRDGFYAKVMAVINR
jgi:8-oxo-dGTP pyrophosphatase MutT (NUDIX family)